MQSEVALDKPATPPDCVETAPFPVTTVSHGTGGVWQDVSPADRRARQLCVRLANAGDRQVIYRLRHEIFARELGQHATNEAGLLTDPLDAFNTYIVISAGDRIVGFVSITPPGGPGYSIDKYLKREQLPFPVDDRLYEVRLMSVCQSSRRSLLALALMYASFRWVEAHGGTRIMAIGRREILSMHFRVGLKLAGQTVKSGAVTYELIQATMADIHESLGGVRKMLDRVEAEMAWQIGVAYHTPAACYHGGDFFKAVGDEFRSLDRLESVINADVLDAWFPPSPKAVAAIERHLPQILRTSPPTSSEGLVRILARVRDVKPECLLPGAGSSDLIFLALRHWLTPQSRVLILDPTYGEYAHLLEQVIHCHVDRLALRRNEAYRLDVQRLEQHLADPYDLVVLVNPNSPTGQHVPRADLERVLKTSRPATRIWLDETYVEYVGPDQSLEPFAARSQNVIVCKSMSKAYALSGARVAYLCAGPHQLESLKAITPPWVVSLPAQVAAVKALEDGEYYAAKYEETRVLRRQLCEGLKPLGWEIVPGVANFVLCHLRQGGLNAETLVARCRERGLFLRNVATMGSQLGDDAIRIAVKDAETNRRMVEILREVAGVFGKTV
jgi:histidinol-phosphate/aromatic aminotransferase/cobyric acid decarboxylase-like protein/N-acyl-L-homoserine lactone synthetase